MGARPLVVFTWNVSRDGYRWEDAVICFSSPEDHERNARLPAEDRLVLTDGRPILGSLPGAYREYQPLMESTGLFRIFADTPITRQGIVGFASRYGTLGQPIECMVDINVDPPIRTYGESFRGWQREITLMREALQLWDWIKAADHQSLHRYAMSIMEMRLPRDRFCEDHERRHLHLADWYMPGNGDEIHDSVARMLVIGKTDPSARVYNFLHYLVNYQLRHLVQAQVHEDSRTGDLGLHMIPLSLLGAMWLQFAQSMTSKREFTQCRECGLWFEVHPDTARTNRRFCSNACRSKAYRGRQSQARLLSREGMHPAEIAQRLDTDEQTVASWLRSGGSSGSQISDG